MTDQHTTYAVEIRIPRSPQRLDLVRLKPRFSTAQAAHDWAQVEWAGYPFDIIREPHEEIVRIEKEAA